MSEREIAEQTLAELLKAGFDKATSRISKQEMHELQSENGELKLLRTGFQTSLSIAGIVDNRRATLGINKTDQSTVAESVRRLKSMADASEPDPAHDIAAEQPAERFKRGIDQPDYDAMYDRLVELTAYVGEEHPTVNLRSSSVVFSKGRSVLRNSNGVDFETESGSYSVGLQFTAKEGPDTSSMNFTGYSTLDLDTPIHQTNDVDTLLRQSAEQVRTQHIPAKFTGNLVISPHCVTTFTGFLTGRIGDAMISGTSIYEGKLGEVVASEELSVHAMPLSDELTTGYSVTSDGHRALDSTVIENGELKTYLLSLYGANKMGLPRAVNSGGCYVIDPGEQSFDEIIAGISEGIYINRFPGGRPSDRGDFSGVAKNSYYIRDGKIQFPIQETTVSGNLADLLKSVDGISSERLNSGSSILPWISVSGVTAS